MIAWEETSVNADTIINNAITAIETTKHNVKPVVIALCNSCRLRTTITDIDDNTRCLYCGNPFDDNTVVVAGNCNKIPLGGVESSRLVNQ
jgi:uncharacterized CHY-type Zn-finger protein